MTSPHPCTVYELRQYTVRPHVRDAFVTLFDAELLESQDAAGMRVLGQFRDLDRPDVFVWLRGFEDMSARRRALQAFYEGPVWAAHREAANAMIVDSDDVLLLECAEPGPALDHHAEARPPTGISPPATLLAVEVCPLAPQDAHEYLHRHRSTVAPLLRHAGGRPLPPLRTLHAANTFPRLPVREGEHVAVTLTGFTDRAAAEALFAVPAYRAATADLDGLALAAPQRLRLVPTARSALR